MRDDMGIFMSLLILLESKRLANMALLSLRASSNTTWLWQYLWILFDSFLSPNLPSFLDRT